MANYTNSDNYYPEVVKIIQPYYEGIRLHTLTRHAIGYVLSGSKLIYEGDSTHTVKTGELFYLSPGAHYMDDIPEDKKPFTQLVFYYTPEILSRYIVNMSFNFGLGTDGYVHCDDCDKREKIVFDSWELARHFFSSLDGYISSGSMVHNRTLQSVKMLELICLVFSHEDCCLRYKFLGNTDSNKESFEQIINRNIFNDVTIEALARQCNRSLTSFKQEFRKYYSDPPHRWFTKQRLAHSRIMLISGSKSISEIGNECKFPNTSHYIKLFKKEYGMTPAVYRNHYHMTVNTPEDGFIVKKRNGKQAPDVKAEPQQKKDTKKEKMPAIG